MSVCLFVGLFACFVVCLFVCLFVCSEYHQTVKQLVLRSGQVFYIDHQQAEKGATSEKERN